LRDDDAWRLKFLKKDERELVRERFFNCLLAFDFLICGVLVDAKRRTNFDRQTQEEKRKKKRDTRNKTGETKKQAMTEFF